MRFEVRWKKEKEEEKKIVAVSLRKTANKSPGFSSKKMSFFSAFAVGQY